MSKIGTLVFELQEQANELGFETVEEACMSGYKVDFNKVKLVKE